MREKERKKETEQKKRGKNRERLKEGEQEKRRTKNKRERLTVRGVGGVRVCMWLSADHRFYQLSIPLACLNNSHDIFQTVVFVYLAKLTTLKH